MVILQVDAQTASRRQEVMRETHRLLTSIGCVQPTATRPKVVWHSVRQTNHPGLEMLQSSVLARAAVTPVFASWNASQVPMIAVR